MAGDWIKMRTDLYRDPKVCLIADALLDEEGDLARHVNQICRRDMTVTRNVMRNVTVGAMVTLWGVMRHRGKRKNDDLFLPKCALCVIDDIADLPGLGEAMAVVGWAVEKDGGLLFPNFFEELNVDPAEEMRAKNAERQRRYREKQSENRNVTVTLHRNEKVTLEKRREEKRNNKKEEGKSLFSLPCKSGEWNLTQSYLDELAAAYPKLRLDMRKHFSEMRAWLVSNPTKLKTAQGMGAFVNRWLKKANDEKQEPERVERAPTIAETTAARRLREAQALERRSAPPAVDGGAA